MWKILMFEIPTKKGLRDVILDSEEKTSDLAALQTFHFTSLFTQFWRCKIQFCLPSIQTFNEHSRMAKLSQPYLRGHMRWNVTSQ